MIATLVGVCALSAVAQAAPRASIAGMVRVAETGEPLAGALVVLGDLERGIVTGPDGRYEILDVPAGPVHVTVEHPGHVTRLLHVLVPSQGRLRIDVSVQAAPIELEELRVTRVRPVRGIDPDDSTSFPDRGVSANAVRSHPSLTEPDVLRALAGGMVVVDPEAPIGLHVRGGATDHVAYVLDGIPVLNPVHSAGVFSAWNPDAIAGIRLISAAPSPALPDALAGVVTAETRAPGGRTRVYGGLSNTQARATVDGPVGVADAGYLVSARTGFPGPLGGEVEASYLTGETSDFLATVGLPSWGGAARLLYYEAENEIDAAGDVPEEASGPGDGARSGYRWQSRSAGVTWVRELPDLTLRFAAWSVRAATGAEWTAAAGPTNGAGTVQEEGAHLGLEWRDTHATSGLGLRVRFLRSRWAVSSAAAPSWQSDATAPIAQAYVEHARRLAATVDARVGGTVSAAAGAVSLAPRLELRWRAADRLAWSAAFARTQQFAQSARNAESVVGHIFPADVFLAADGADVPVPASDQLVLAGEWVPVAGVRIVGQTYTRRVRDLLLVAPAETEPVATSRAPVGTATSRGASIDVSASGARFGVVAGYGWQDVVMEVAGSTYPPRHAPAHIVEAGAVLYPSATASVRASLTGAAGRTGTAVAGPFEWEACNLLDRGCEFAGSPRLSGGLGADELSRYVRVDLGARKHWHVRVYGRLAVIGLFGSVSNVFGRANVLTHVIDPDTGGRATVTMLPRAPLAIGLDWRF